MVTGVLEELGFNSDTESKYKRTNRQLLTGRGVGSDGSQLASPTSQLGWAASHTNGQ
jgi:hypothetical protein